MRFLYFKKNIYEWIKNPLGLTMLLIAVLMQILTWPVLFYIEDDYENLKWIKVDVAYISKKTGRYDSNKFIIRDISGDEYLFSYLGFERGGLRMLVETINNKDRVGWYSTCFSWKSVVLGSDSLFDNCAIIMEIDRRGKKIISFEDRLDLLRENYVKVLLEIHMVFFVMFFLSMSVLAYYCKRSYK